MQPSHFRSNHHYQHTSITKKKIIIIIINNIPSSSTFAPAVLDSTSSSHSLSLMYSPLSYLAEVCLTCHSYRFYPVQELVSILELSLSSSCIFLSQRNCTFYQCIESFSDVASIGSRSFQITQSILIGIIFNTLRFDFSHLSKIRFISYQHYRNSSISIILQFPQPFLHILECFRLCYVECNNSSYSSPIVRICYSSKSLLTCRIPYLILNRLPINIGSFCRKLNSNSWLRIHIEGIINKSRKKIRLTHSRISYHNYLKQKIEIFLSTHSINNYKVRIYKIISQPSISYLNPVNSISSRPTPSSPSLSLFFATT